MFGWYLRWILDGWWFLSWSWKLLRCGVSIHRYWNNVWGFGKVPWFFCCLGSNSGFPQLGFHWSPSDTEDLWAGQNSPGDFVVAFFLWALETRNHLFGMLLPQALRWCSFCRYRLGSVNSRGIVQQYPILCAGLCRVWMSPAMPNEVSKHNFPCVFTK